MAECRVFSGDVCVASVLCKGKTSCRRWVRSDEGRAAAAARAAIRTFPLPVFPVDGRPANWCRWCGDAIVHGRVRQRAWHDGREDEPKCRLAYDLHTLRDAQYRHVARRDGERCFDCHKTPGRWLRETYETTIWVEDWPKDIPRPRYVGVRRVVALELEHVTPLWSVAHLTDDERRPFFGPDNLRLRCVPCHKLKSKGETGVRAKGKRQAKMRLDAPREPAKMKSGGKLPGGRKLPGKGEGRKMQSRGFSAAARPLRAR